MNVGILHPGKMGIVVAISAKHSGHEVLWASEGRSPASRKRAADAGLTDAGSLEELFQKSAVAVSVCPPEFADAVADQALHCGFRGTFVDANAISPERVKAMARRLEQKGVDFVDGGIIGMPSLTPAFTWLHLSGGSAARVAECFAKGPMATEVLGDEIGRASALKMCFAAYTKGSTALACAVAGAAQEYGVFEDLARAWERKGPGMKKVEADILLSAPKAWRFIAEMHEIAATLEGAGLPPGFHRAAAELYERLRDLKDSDPTFEEVLARLAARSAVSQAR
jgi:3-hydroxyisobutyrate dehydrogenase-like beta-hydroxyacid dehydrogenase